MGNEIDNAVKGMAAKEYGTDFNYLEKVDLKPVSVFNATVGGLFKGAFIGGGVGFLPFMVAGKEGEELGFGKNGVKATLLVGVVSSVLGAVMGYNKAKIHNDWAARTEKKIDENDRMTHAERALASKEQAAQRQVA